MFERIQDCVELGVSRLMQQATKAAHSVRQLQDWVEGWVVMRRQRVTRLFLRD